MAANALPQTEFLHKILSYNPDTGDFHWKSRERDMFGTNRGCSVWNARYAEAEAGCKATGHGYHILVIGNRHYLAHRIAWKMMTGGDPDFVDHINHDRSDNRFANLRNVSATGNATNVARRTDNKSGVTGVVWDKQTGKWRAMIKCAGIEFKLGRFLCIDDAIAARKAAEADLGFHPNHGAKR